MFVKSLVPLDTLRCGHDDSADLEVVGRSSAADFALLQTLFRACHVWEMERQVVDESKGKGVQANKYRNGTTVRRPNADSFLTYATSAQHTRRKAPGQRYAIPYPEDRLPASLRHLWLSANSAACL